MTQQREPHFDDLDRRLIAELTVEPRLPYSTLGSRMGVTGMTAANRLRRLQEADLIRFRAQPNLERCGLATQILGLLQADNDALGACAEALQKSPYVIRIDHITGEYDFAFVAVFPSESVMGDLVRELRTIDGVRRLVVHHRLETMKDEEGWAAIWAERSRPEEQAYELAPGVHIPERLRGDLAVAVDWARAVAESNVDALRRLSDPEIVFTVMPPTPGAGTYAGLDEVLRAAALNRIRHLWWRILNVAPASEPFDVVMDVLSTTERTRGQVVTMFIRLAYGFAGGRVRRCVNLGELHLPELPDNQGALAAAAEGRAGG